MIMFLALLYEAVSIFSKDREVQIKPHIKFHLVDALLQSWGYVVPSFNYHYP